MADQEPRVEKVRLRDLAPNPFNKIPLEDDAVSQLKTQIQSRGYHDHLKGRRRKDGKVEIAFGHHRKEAMTAVYGEDHEVEIEISDLTDLDMIEEMAGDNDSSFNCTLKKLDNAVRAIRDYCRDHPEEQKEILSSEDSEDNSERIRPGAPRIAKRLHKKISQVESAIERVNAIDDGVVDSDALYLMANAHLADIFIALVKDRTGLDKKYHLPIAKFILKSDARTKSQMELCVYNACRWLEKKGLSLYDRDRGYNKTFKRLAGTMNQLRLSLFYLPTEVNNFFSEDGKRVSDAIRLKDLSAFRSHMIGLGKELDSIRQFIESKVPAEVWTHKEVKTTKKQYQAFLARTKRLQGKNVILHPGQLRKDFGLHKKADVPWERYYLWQVEKMIKQGKFYYKPDPKDNQNTPQVASRAKQKKSRNRSSH